MIKKIGRIIVCLQLDDWMLLKAFEPALGCSPRELNEKWFSGMYVKFFSFRKTKVKNRAFSFHTDCSGA